MEGPHAGRAAGRFGGADKVGPSIVLARRLGPPRLVSSLRSQTGSCGLSSNSLHRPSEDAPSVGGSAPLRHLAMCHAQKFNQRHNLITARVKLVEQRGQKPA